MRKLLLGLALAGLLLTPALAADLDFDGLDDATVNNNTYDTLDFTDIAVVDIGGGNAGFYIDRLQNLGYTVTPIPMSSDLATLVQYGLVILPVGHAAASTYNNFDSHAADYISYVEMGGGLWVGQPNPFQMPGNNAVITWVPYYLYINNGYDGGDCPPTLVDPDHCITEGLPANVHSFSGDTVLDMGSEWQILLQGGSTGLPAVFFAETAGGGKILVELGHPSPSAICSPDDSALIRYVECTYGMGPTATESGSWSGVKKLYR